MTLYRGIGFNMGAMRIGELAEQAGINIQTIRFYEREQILEKPKRTASGYRAYTGKDLQQVVFVKVCQSLGFTLGEIRLLTGLHASLLSVSDLDSHALEEICALAAARLRVIDEKIQALQGMRQSLLQLLDQPQRCPSHKQPANKS